MKLRGLPFVSFVPFVCGALASSVALTGCHATPGARFVVTDDDLVYGEAPPPHVENYPLVVYQRTPHYYVDGRWYRRTSHGWGYYRHEPDHLALHRPQARREESGDGHGDRGVVR